MLGGLVVDSLTGASLFPDAQPEQGFRVVTFSNILGGSFDAMRLVSSRNAFEFANLTAYDSTPASVSSPVPLPAGGLLLSGAGILALVRRRPKA
ncbi:MAG: hypothetical protein ACJAVR_001561 [Paracoccaceae bacterium]|jgi:hypothetical protein